MHGNIKLFLRLLTEYGLMTYAFACCAHILLLLEFLMNITHCALHRQFVREFKERGSTARKLLFLYRQYYLQLCTLRSKYLISRGSWRMSPTPTLFQAFSLYRALTLCVSYDRLSVSCNII